MSPRLWEEQSIFATAVSPIPMGFNEASQQKKVVLVEFSGTECDIPGTDGTLFSASCQFDRIFGKHYGIFGFNEKKRQYRLGGSGVYRKRGRSPSEGPSGRSSGGDGSRDPEDKKPSGYGPDY